MSFEDDDRALIEFWHERAAIREYDGGYDRQRANFLAAREVRYYFGRVPQVIIDQVRNGIGLEHQRKLFEDS